MKSSGEAASCTPSLRTHVLPVSLKRAEAAVVLVDSRALKLLGLAKPLAEASERHRASALLRPDLATASQAEERKALRPATGVRLGALTRSTPRQYRRFFLLHVRMLAPA